MRIHMTVPSLVLAGILAAVAMPAMAQKEGPPSGMPEMLDESDPNVGDRFPNVTVLDDEGRKFRTADLKGKYTVLVFGCLT